MNLKKLYLLKKLLLQSKNNNDFYLTTKQKSEFLKKEEKIPLRVKGNGRELKTIVKTRGTIESGELKKKRMGL